jgi:hypothetical protein
VAVMRVYAHVFSKVCNPLFRVVYGAREFHGDNSRSL